MSSPPSPPPSDPLCAQMSIPTKLVGRSVARKELVPKSERGLLVLSSFFEGWSTGIDVAWSSRCKIGLRAIRLHTREARIPGFVEPGQVKTGCCYVIAKGYLGATFGLAGLINQACSRCAKYSLSGLAESCEAKERDWVGCNWKYNKGALPKRGEEIFMGYGGRVEGNSMVCGKCSEPMGKKRK